jgi:hypothetical protein
VARSLSLRADECNDEYSNASARISALIASSRLNRLSLCGFGFSTHFVDGFYPALMEPAFYAHISFVTATLRYKIHGR